MRSASGFAVDSLQEGAGLEPSVPLEVLTVGIVPCRLRGPFHASLPKTKFAADSALEEDGFEPPVPPTNKAVSPAEQKTAAEALLRSHPVPLTLTKPRGLLASAAFSVTIFWMPSSNMLEVGCLRAGPA